MSDILIGTAFLSGYVNVFNDQWLGIIIPLLLLFATLIFFAIDFGAVGIGLISSISMVIFWWVGFIPVNIVALISFIIIVIITLFKVTR